MTGRKPYHLVLCGSLALAALAGCQDHSSGSSPAPSPSPTEIVTIFIGGRCNVDGPTIACEDASRSDPQNRLTKVNWELIKVSTGRSQGVTPSSPGGEISFTGLFATDYQVNQTVFASDGSSQQKTYGPLSVGSVP